VIQKFLKISSEYLCQYILKTGCVPSSFKTLRLTFLEQFGKNAWFKVGDCSLTIFPLLVVGENIVFHP
tara:strand:+ start:256 stop:459 length:204 start_codon:yes stop_codon:yes gene_type:complete